MNSKKGINPRRIIGRITSAENGIRVQSSKRSAAAQYKIVSRAERDLSRADRALLANISSR